MPPVIYSARFVLPINDVPIEDGAILADKGRIIAVDRRNTLIAAHPGTSVVDFCDAVLLPPMVNAHTHLELSHIGEWAALAGTPQVPSAFVDWILWLVAVKRTVSTRQIRASLADGLRQSLSAGTGAVGEILTTLEAAPEYLASPLSGRVFAEVLGQHQGVVETRLDAIKGLLGNLPSSTLDWGLSPHAPYTLSPSATERVFRFAREHRLQSSIHLAESPEETLFIAEGRGAIAEKLYAAAQWDSAVYMASGDTPVKTLCRPHRLQSGDLVVHGVQVNEADVELLKQRRCPVVLCPRSNARLDVGKAPVSAYLKAGVPLALGTDSLASSSSLSVWDELAFARRWFCGTATPAEWLQIATCGGAKALGLHRWSGQFAPGYQASFQVVTLPEMPGLYELEEALCAAGGSLEVIQLYLAGRNVLS